MRRQDYYTIYAPNGIRFTRTRRPLTRWQTAIIADLTAYMKRK